MPKEIQLFQKEELSFKMKFYVLMDLLITNQVESRVESFILMGIFYLQILSSFFAPQIGVFDSEESKSDMILNYIQKITRLKDLFINNYTGFQTLLICLFVIFIICIIHFLLTVLSITRSSFYSYNKIFINYYLKGFIYIAYNIILDLCFSNFCFGSDQYNPYFEGTPCSPKNHIGTVIIGIIFAIAALVFNIFIQIYYCDSFYLSNSYYAKMSCNYDIYWSLNCLVNSILLTQAKYLTKEIFLIYNLLISIVLFIFYIEHYLYYDKVTNIFAGIFHTLYAWSSIFFLIFAYINFKEKGIIYLLTSIIACFFYMNLKNKIESSIFLDTPFHKIKNKFYLLYYFRNLIDKINSIEENPEDKAFLSGIMQMHGVECPNPRCLLKTKDPIYLPIANKWSDRSKRLIDDDVFLKNFLIIVMNYFLYTHGCSVDMYLNLSLYFLKIIGNYCQAMYHYKKVTELKLSPQEEFTFVRLNIQISKALIEKLKPSNEQCVSLEHLDVSMYYKYDALSQNFVDEISNDVNLSLEFWKTFRASLRESTKKIDFNKIFQLTDKIRITKSNVEAMWNSLLSIYGGVNDFFELYTEYVEQINDDDLKKRDLESLKRKSDNYSDHISQNFYSVLFNKDTGIIIANGDKGSEGIIELSNKEIEYIFKYKPSDLKGMNLTHLMPRLFAKDHSKYMERYFKVGEKKLIDKTDFRSFAKDKNNSIVKIKLALKLFPVLNDNVFFVGMILKENIDDIILMDENFNIQGMSTKLMKILNIDNKFLFQENEIPFYVICRKFVNFYNIFLQGKKKGDTPGENFKGENSLIDDEDKEKNEGKNKDSKKEKNEGDKDDIRENIEINENVELEYEIKLPQFLIDYSEKTNKKDAKLGLKLMSMASETVEDGNESPEEFNEDDLLVDDSKEKTDGSKGNQISNLNSSRGNNRNSTPQTPDQGATTTGGGVLTPNPDGTPTTPDGDIENKDIQKNENIKLGFNKQSEEEKMYKSKIKQYKTLFETGKFGELEDLIDVCNKDSSSIEYKFNFTFDRYKYGEKQISYIVRCIDNKNDAGKSDEESIGEYDIKAAKYKKEKAEAIKPLFELLEEEKKEIISLPDTFLKLSLENKRFQRLLQLCKNDIMNMSMAHGQKKDEVMEDENSSQSSQAGFDSGLVKKNRIEEIRSNLLINISSFYTLKYIKLVIVLLALCTFIFCLLYIIIFSSLYSSLIDVSSVNIGLFQTTLWSTELVSIFLSLETLFKNEVMNYNETTSPYFKFLNYETSNITNNVEYYDQMVLLAETLYYNISSYYGTLEMDIPKYLSESELMSCYWDRLNVTYYDSSYMLNGQVDDESFPMSVAQILSNAISYLSDPCFKITVEGKSNYTASRTTKEVYFKYLTHLIIENSYDNLLKNQFTKVLTIPDKLKDYNTNKKQSIIIIISVYASIMILLCVAYYFLIHLTNKSMTDGLEKVTKIRVEKIEETIKKIEAFNSNLKRFRDKDSKSGEDNKENSEISEEQNNQNAQGGSQNDQNTQNSNQGKKGQVNNSSIVGSNGFNTDIKKYIPLSVLSYSYIHCLIIFAILCGFLIPIFIYSNKMVTSTNQLLLVQKYIFGKLISSSASTVEVKCFMSNCLNTTVLEYDDLVNMSLIQDVIKGINIFSEVSDFYNNKFLLNACGAAIKQEENPSEYSLCLNDSLIESANNTDNLIKLIEDIVDNIYKEDEMDKDTDIEVTNKNNKNGTVEKTKYFREYLFSTSYFQQMEQIFYKYIIPVGDNFADLVTKDLENFLSLKRTLVIILGCCLGALMIIYCLIFGVIFVKKLIHYLSVSRCIMKIIPTSVIISTQELETWIENKY